MKKKCLFTAEQKEVVVENYWYFGKYFADNGFIDAWSRAFQSDFRYRLEKFPVKHQSKQLGILIGYYIYTKDYDYFISNKEFDYGIYITKTSFKGWAGFANKVIGIFQQCSSDEEIKSCIDTLHIEIFL
jgi:hypothetical protein